jgi:anti-anti-sigma regulatory factor
MGVQLRVVPRNCYLLLVAEGDLSEGDGVPPFRHDLNGALRSTARDVVLDVTHLSGVSSRSLAVLAASRERLAARGRRLVLVDAGRGSREAWEEGAAGFSRRQTVSAAALMLEGDGPEPRGR